MHHYMRTDRVRPLPLIRLPFVQRNVAPGQSVPQTFGLRDDEVATALDIVTHVLPCLHLFTSRMPDGDLHETFADVFTVLKVSVTSYHPPHDGSNPLASLICLWQISVVG
jgi:hypothetical protein